MAPIGITIDSSLVNLGAYINIFSFGY